MNNGSDQRSQLSEKEWGEREYAAAAERGSALDPKVRAAAFDQKRAMEKFVPGTFDPGPAVLDKLDPTRAGRLLLDAGDAVEIEAHDNPDPWGSFGYVGAFGYLGSDKEFLPGTLVLRFESKHLGGVARETLRLFHWDELAGTFSLVSHSGVSQQADYVWGRTTEGGVYAAIGLHANPLVVRTLMLSSAVTDLMRAVGADLTKGVHDRVGDVLFSSGDLQSAVGEMPVLEALGRAEPPPELPDPRVSWNPDRRFEEADRFWEVWRAAHGRPATTGFRLPEQALLLRDSALGSRRCLFSSWESLGPLNIAGCALQVAVDPADSNRIYAASADGGLWRLGDVRAYPAQVWEPLTDRQESLRTRAVAIAPTSSRTVYIADGLNRLVRSTDGGASWRAMGTRDIGFVRKILVDRDNPSGVFVASNTGLWRSRNGGRDWDSNAEHRSFYDGDITDAVVDPDTPSVVYIAVRNHGLLRSSDGGRSWTGTHIWDPRRSYWTDDRHQTTMIKVALSRRGTADDRTVVVKFGQEIFVNTTGGRGPALGGGEWVSKGKLAVADDHRDNGYGDHCHVLAIHPFDSNIILAGAQRLFRTVDGGSRWDVVVDYFRATHADQQSIAFDERQPGVVYLANDGGVYRSSDNGATWNDLNYGLVTGQFYSVGMSGTRGLTGMYHQGIVGSQDATTGEWELLEGGAWEWANLYGDRYRPSVFYPVSQGLSRRRYPGTGTGDFLVPWGTPSFTPYAVLASTSAGMSGAAVAVDPQYDSYTIIVAASNPGRVMRTTTGDSDRPQWTAEPGTDTGRDPITAVAFAPRRWGTAYAASGSGRIFRKAQVNGDEPWEERGRFMPGGVRQIAVNGLHADRLYLVSGDKVARSEDGGRTWAEIPGTGGNMLPNSEFNSIVAHPSDGQTVFLSADIGVFVTRDEGNTWFPFDDGLPNADVIQIFWNLGYLYAVTHGRGLWRRWGCL